VAYDAATEDTFRKYRGEGADSFLDWEQYWRVLDMALPVFGKRKVGGHLIVGLGETEEEMTAAFQNMRDRGGQTHLFSFYPEPHSILEGREPPPMEQYRRMQLARFIIDKGIAGFKDFRFGEDGRLLDYGIESSRLKQIVDCREPFMTSGCPGEDGMTACNRPFANCRPGPQLRNYPFQPDSGDMARIKRTLYNKEITGLEQDVEQPHQEA
jgi:biotin synthase